MKEIKLSAYGLTGLNDLKIFLLHIRRVQLFKKRENMILTPTNTNNQILPFDNDVYGNYSFVRLRVKLNAYDYYVALIVN